MSIISISFSEWLRFARLAESYDPAKQAQAQHFEAIFTRYQQPITVYLYRLTGDEGIASDLSQETFLLAWQHLEQLRDPQAIRAWLYRIATNTATRYAQRNKTHQITELPDDWPGMSDPGRRIAEQ